MPPCPNPPPTQAGKPWQSSRSRAGYRGNRVGSRKSTATARKQHRVHVLLGVLPGPPLHNSREPPHTDYKMSSLEACAEAALSAGKCIWVNGLFPAQGPRVFFCYSLTKTMYCCPLFALCPLLGT